jgi:hypothetical protein
MRTRPSRALSGQSEQPHGPRCAAPACCLAERCRPGPRQQEPAADRIAGRGGGGGGRREYSWLVLNCQLRMPMRLAPWPWSWSLVHLVCWSVVCVLCAVWSVWCWCWCLLQLPAAAAAASCQLPAASTRIAYTVYAPAVPRSRSPAPRPSRPLVGFSC